MNPEDNNQSTNPFSSGSGGMTNNPDPMSGMGGMSMSDNLASAQDNLTAAGMAADQGSSAIGLDQLAMTDPNSAMLPPIEEPLVPAPPVPGSIGSAISAPQTDTAAPAPVPASNPFNSPSVNGNPNDLSSVSATSSSAPSPTPEAAPAAPAAPFNPFASSATSNATSTGNSATPQPSPLAAPLAAPAPGVMPNPAPTPTPMGAVAPKSKSSLSPLTLIFGALAAVFLVTSIILFILWDGEKKAAKTVVSSPAISEEDSNSEITILSCSRSESREEPSALGTNIVAISYTGDELSAISSVQSLNYNNADDANAARDANEATVELMTGLVGGSLSVSSNVDGSNYVYSITSQDGKDITAQDAMNVIYGPASSNSSLALEDVQAEYEANGFVCSTD